MSSIDFATKSIEFHDPNRLWYAFKGTIQIHTYFEEFHDTTQTIDLYFNNPESEFSYHNLTSQLQADFKRGDCQSEPKQCQALGWTNDFYTYTYGLPMKFLDPKTTIDGALKDTVVFDKEVLQLHIDYGKHNWWYFLNKDNYQLEGFRFHNKENGNKEIVNCTGIYTIDGIKVPSKKEWYRYPTMEFLGYDQVVRHRSQ